MQYAKRISPNECRMEAVKRKMESEFLASSSNSEEEEGQGSKNKEKKTNIDVSKEAQEAHKTMCEKSEEVKKPCCFLFQITRAWEECQC